MVRSFFHQYKIIFYNTTLVTLLYPSQPDQTNPAETNCKTQVSSTLVTAQFAPFLWLLLCTFFFSLRIRAILSWTPRHNAKTLYSSNSLSCLLKYTKYTVTKIPTHQCKRYNNLFFPNLYSFPGFQLSVYCLPHFKIYFNFYTYPLHLSHLYDIKCVEFLCSVHREASLVSSLFTQNIKIRHCYRV